MSANKNTIGVLSVAALFAVSGALAANERDETDRTQVQGSFMPYFSAADNNKDKSVSEAEFTQYLKARYKELDTDKSGTLEKAELKDKVKGPDGNSQTTATFLAMNDVNRDNALTYDEYVKQAQSSFRISDRNGDGKISADEAQPKTITPTPNP